MIDDEKHGTVSPGTKSRHYRVQTNDDESTVDASLRGRADTVWNHSAHAVDVEKNPKSVQNQQGGGKVPTRRARASWYLRLESRGGRGLGRETAPTC
ncbi:hypothetical protein E4U54_004566 [Claviceps lovelessii]|nr:hypothetical protein E4U54_004566 [Claviceps lovelessii]